MRISTVSMVVVGFFVAGLVAGCGGGAGDASPSESESARGTPADTAAAVASSMPAGTTIDIGCVEGYSAATILGGLSNPSSVSFSPEGVLTVCDSAAGRVILVKDGKAEDYITGFTTEFWKGDHYKLGPLSAIWIGKVLYVTDGGQLDGAETVNAYTAAGKADSASKTSNPVGPTSDDTAVDKGEGNLSGIAFDGKDTIYVCGQGADARTWLLTCTLGETLDLQPWASADENGIEINSPMQIRMLPNGNVLALYSGVGGTAGALMAEWAREGKAATLVRKWSLGDLVNPMGFDAVPGKPMTFAVVENNWDLNKVNRGRVARVTLNSDGTIAAETIATGLDGPVACTFGPDGRLYIAQLGTEFDKDKGSVIAVKGF
jgi:glucose/arabinose dehydrogenase